MVTEIMLLLSNPDQYVDRARRRNLWSWETSHETCAANSSMLRELLAALACRCATWFGRYRPGTR
jgi:hypothetical protein